MAATEEGTDAIPPELGVRPPHASDASVPPPPPPAAVAPPPPPQVAAASPSDLLVALHSHAVSLNLSEEPPGSMRYHLGAAGALGFVGHLRTVRGSWKATCRSGHGSLCSFFLSDAEGRKRGGDLGGLARLARGRPVIDSRGARPSLIRVQGQQVQDAGSEARVTYIRVGCRESRQE